MFVAHSFNIGRPDSLVYVDEFLALLRVCHLFETINMHCCLLACIITQSLLGGLQCLYCERVFRDRTVLKSHMRKKKHYKISAHNKAFDHFYLVNYTVRACAACFLAAFNQDDFRHPPLARTPTLKQRVKLSHCSSLACAVYVTHADMFSHSDGASDIEDELEDSTATEALCLLCETPLPSTYAVFAHMRVRHCVMRCIPWLHCDPVHGAD